MLSEREQNRQALRLRRVGIAALTYLFVVICVRIVDWSLGNPIPPIIWLCIVTGAVLGNISFAILIKSNINLKFSDPSLTSFQIVFSACWGLLTVLSLYEVRALILMLYLPSFLFGSLKLKRLEYFRLVVLISVLLLLGLLFERIYLRQDLNMTYEFFLWFVFTLLLVWFALFGSYLNELRHKLSFAKSNLEKTHHELTVANEKLKLSAETDYLTGILTRRGLYNALSLINKKSSRPFCVVLADIDKFKYINDTYGHDTGDKVLIEVVNRIRCSLREQDIIARWGGEEFLIVLIGVTKKSAVDIICRLNQSLSNQAILIDGISISVTLSEGLVEVDSLSNFDNIIKQADTLLYQAKNKGRNRLETEIDISSP